ncbi:MAG: hypothetical protein HQL42_15545 [Alphaproteobacteria bacterium]|nr:hypothetical protein [Alphaproteobacteria bacterium]
MNSFTPSSSAIPATSMRRLHIESVEVLQRVARMLDPGGEMRPRIEVLLERLDRHPLVASGDHSSVCVCCQDILALIGDHLLRDEIYMLIQRLRRARAGIDPYLPNCTD